MECREPGQVHDIDWHEKNYRDLLREGADDAQRLDALEALLEEQYIERYMTEFAALALRNGRERDARRILKKQMFLYSGGPWEELGQRLMEEGEAAAEEALAQLKDGDMPEADGAEETVEETARPVPSLERVFQGIVGMGQARAALESFWADVDYQSARAGYELKTRRRYHFFVGGDPGTGKTMLSQRIGQLLFELGVASQAEPCVLESYRLAELLGTNGAGLEEALDQCEERNVVIDGISALFDSDNAGTNRTFLLRTILERYADKVNFFLLGSRRDIQRLLAAEPTLSGWVLYRIELPAYSPEELVEIAAAIAREQGYLLSASARQVLAERMEAECRAPAFQGGKSLEAMVNRASLRLAYRVAETGAGGKGALMRIEPQDLDDSQDGPDLDQLLAQLDALTGLSSVKAQVHKLTALARTNREAKRLGLSSAGFGTLHMVFTGNAGTGKTTVARIIGGIYQALGVLPNGERLVECTRADLVAGYVGQTAPKVKAKVEEAMGGVLFIDEAYSLCADNDSFGQEAVDTLVAEVENHRNELMVILAGYSEDMDKFLNRNQGLSSRFPNRMEFEDYTQAEMEEIFRGMLSGADKTLAEGCDALLRAYIEANRTKQGFGNARGIRNLRDELIAAQSLRLSAQLETGAQLTQEDFATITAEDFADLGADAKGQKTLEDWLAELDALTGLASVKEQVHRMVNTVIGQQKMREAGLSEGAAAGGGTMHMAFRGNAGTGKTTVARIIAGIYSVLGLLPDGDIFIELENPRAELIAPYVGQTAPKVKEVIQRAMGGVLFIDEAYSLCRDANDSFGREAVDALIAGMENHRKELMVIVAGYSEDLDRFFTFNQGMTSRVPTKLTFEDYTLDELTQIFQGMMKAKGFAPSDEVTAKARELIDEERQKPGFGNARGVRNIVERTAQCHIANLGERTGRGETLEREDYLTILPEELQAP